MKQWIARCIAMITFGAAITFIGRLAFQFLKHTNPGIFTFSFLLGGMLIFNGIVTIKDRKISFARLLDPQDIVIASTVKGRFAVFTGWSFLLFAIPFLVMPFVF